jgi:hypothetical protein
MQPIANRTEQHISFRKVKREQTSGLITSKTSKKGNRKSASKNLKRNNSSAGRLMKSKEDSSKN